jgi:serine/threonine protein kinase
MSVNGTDSLEREQRLDDILTDYLKAVDAGQTPDRQQLLHEFPELADELGEFFSQQDKLDRWARPLRPAATQRAEATPPGATNPAAPDVLASFGDYELLEPLGQGGMGVVYKARQRSLQRLVALKVLRFAETDPRQLQRFHNEARAAASLEHPHIVPVHGVGCEQGVHFYAMKFIDGRTLAEVITERRGSTSETRSAQPSSGSASPSPVPPSSETAPAAAKVTTAPVRPDRAFFQRVAEWGVQAAEALEHAHALGIVHRDVKPANLMVEAQGHLWVTDFGLARFGTDAGLTLTGDVLGTLRYMSPEQALAKHGLVDHRTDIYFLGATLYELLTLRPAFDGKDREELLRQITFEEPLPPRRHEKGIPAELETIVLKAMEKNPTDRYATAQELADDLRRFLENRPIQARRPGVILRLRKWGRRHTAVVWSAVAVLLTAVVALSVSTVMIAQAKNATDQAYMAAVEQSNRAEIKFAESRRPFSSSWLLTCSGERCPRKNSATRSLSKRSWPMQNERSTGVWVINPKRKQWSVMPWGERIRSLESFKPPSVICDVPSS